MPDPIIEPATSAVESIKPRLFLNSGFSASIEVYVIIVFQYRHQFLVWVWISLPEQKSKGSDL
jgi:hypothetical protein